MFAAPTTVTSIGGNGIQGAGGSGTDTGDISPKEFVRFIHLYRVFLF
jgi:hypothetical protein